MAPARPRGHLIYDIIYPKYETPKLIMFTSERITELLRNGEGLGVEFKRCSGKVEHDVFETICAFLNRFGGDILLGVEDDGAVVGVKGDAAALRNNIVNVLIHREFTSSRPARFVIEQDRMFIENACRASSGEIVTPDNIEPDPKNPIIASFFREIAYAPTWFRRQESLQVRKGLRRC